MNQKHKYQYFLSSILASRLIKLSNGKSRLKHKEVHQYQLGGNMKSYKGGLRRKLKKELRLQQQEATQGSATS